MSKIDFWWKKWSKNDLWKHKIPAKSPKNDHFSGRNSPKSWVKSPGKRLKRAQKGLKKWFFAGPAGRPFFPLPKFRAIFGFSFLKINFLLKVCRKNEIFDFLQKKLKNPKMAKNGHFGHFFHFWKNTIFFDFWGPKMTPLRCSSP